MDDTNLLNINTSRKKIQKEINLDLKCLYKWLLANKISLNCSKTELIFFHKPGSAIQNFEFKIKINGHKILPTDHIKYLGIYLDSILSGKYHCEILASKLKRATGMLNKVRHYVPKDELKLIYYAIFSSHMVYGCQIWGQGRGSHFENIFKLQNRALHIINFEDFNANPNPLYTRSNVKTSRLYKTAKLFICLGLSKQCSPSLLQ